MRCRESSGFTLVETLIACGLVVAASLGTMQLFAYALAQNQVARDQLVMGVVAASRLDELAAAARAGTLAPTATDSLDRAVSGCNDAVTEGGRAYQRRWRVAAVPGYPSSVYAITVRVFPAAGGTEVRLTTIGRSPP